MVLSLSQRASLATFVDNMNTFITKFDTMLDQHSATTNRLFETISKHLSIHVATTKHQVETISQQLATHVATTTTRGHHLENGTPTNHYHLYQPCYHHHQVTNPYPIEPPNQAHEFNTLDIGIPVDLPNLKLTTENPPQDTILPVESIPISIDISLPVETTLPTLDVTTIFTCNSTDTLISKLVAFTPASWNDPILSWSLVLTGRVTCQPVTTLVNSGHTYKPPKFVVLQTIHEPPWKIPMISWFAEKLLVDIGCSFIRPPRKPPWIDYQP